jgi:hypothetical protein
MAASSYTGCVLYKIRDRALTEHILNICYAMKITTFNLGLGSRLVDANVNSISLISSLFAYKIRVPSENHSPSQVTDNPSHKVVSSTPRFL